MGGTAGKDPDPFVPAQARRSDGGVPLSFGNVMELENQPNMTKFLQASDCMGVL